MSTNNTSLQQQQQLSTSTSNVEIHNNNSVHNNIVNNNIVNNNIVNNNSVHNVFVVNRKELTNKENVNTIPSKKENIVNNNSVVNNNKKEIVLTTPTIITTPNISTTTSTGLTSTVTNTLQQKPNMNMTTTTSTTPIMVSLINTPNLTNLSNNNSNNNTNIDNLQQQTNSLQQNNTLQNSLQQTTNIRKSITPLPNYNTNYSNYIRNSNYFNHSTLQSNNLQQNNNLQSNNYLQPFSVQDISNNSTFNITNNNLNNNSKERKLSKLFTEEELNNKLLQNNLTIKENTKIENTKIDNTTKMESSNIENNSVINSVTTTFTKMENSMGIVTNKISSLISKFEQSKNISPNLNISPNKSPNKEINKEINTIIIPNKEISKDIIDKMEEFKNKKRESLKNLQKLTSEKSYSIVKNVVDKNLLDEHLREQITKKVLSLKGNLNNNLNSNQTLQQTLTIPISGNNKENINVTSSSSTQNNLQIISKNRNSLDLYNFLLEFSDNLLYIDFNPEREINNTSYSSNNNTSIFSTNNNLENKFLQKFENITKIQEKLGTLLQNSVSPQISEEIQNQLINLENFKKIEQNRKQHLKLMDDNFRNKFKLLKNFIKIIPNNNLQFSFIGSEGVSLIANLLLKEIVKKNRKENSFNDSFKAIPIQEVDPENLKEKAILFLQKCLEEGIILQKVPKNGNKLFKNDYHFIYQFCKDHSLFSIIYTEKEMEDGLQELEEELLIIVKLLMYPFQPLYQVESLQSTKNQLQRNETFVLYKYRKILYKEPKLFLYIIRSIDWKGDYKTGIEMIEILYNDLQNNNLQNNLQKTINFTTCHVLFILFEVNIIYKTDLESLQKLIVKILQQRSIFEIEIFLLPLLFSLSITKFTKYLFNFLIEISLQNENLFNKLIWNLQLLQNFTIYKNLKLNLMEKIKSSNLGNFLNNFNKQIKLMSNLEIFSNYIKINCKELSRPQKMNQLKSILTLTLQNTLQNSEFYNEEIKNHFLNHLQQTNNTSFFDDWNNNEIFPLTSLPCLEMENIYKRKDIYLKSFSPKSVYIFKSAQEPICFPFLVTTNNIENGNNTINGSANEECEFKIIYKQGDDLRQDETVLHLFSLMNHILKVNGIDLEIVTYHCKAITENSGFVEMVSESHPISSIIEKYGTVFQFLKTTSSDNISLFEEKVDRYIRSLAGYSIFTYLLGIGDRHLDNLLIKESGELFHIDFGFILGEDPKPFLGKPPMRISPEMIQDFTKDQFIAFRIYACQCFKILRKFSSIILYYLLFFYITNSYLGNSNLNNLNTNNLNTNNGNSGGWKELKSFQLKNIYLVQENFKLEIREEQLLEEFIFKLIDTSINMLGPKVNEEFHKLAMKFRE